MAAQITIRDIPEKVRDELAARAALKGNSVTSYDAWYVAVAEALGLPLATLETRLARAKGVACRFLTPAGA
jgi:predicted nucleic acid-binding protein